MARSFWTGLGAGGLAVVTTAGIASVVTGPVMAPVPFTGGTHVGTQQPWSAGPVVQLSDETPQATPQSTVAGASSPSLPATSGRSETPVVDDDTAPRPESSSGGFLKDIFGNRVSALKDTEVVTSRDGEIPVSRDGAEPVQPASPGQDTAAIADQDVPEPPKSASAQADQVQPDQTAQSQPTTERASNAESETEETSIPKLPTVTSRGQSERLVSERDTPLPQNTSPQSVDAGDQAEDRGTAGGIFGRGASDFSRLSPDIATNRLPTTDRGATVRNQALASASTAALNAYSVKPPKGYEGNPLLSIILIDDGQLPLGLAALREFPYPLTFAVDTNWDGATAAMAEYRAAGFEVMALTNVPSNARSNDVEVSVQSALDMVPEAVGVLEGDGGGLQSAREITDQTARILARSGLGLVLYPKGLNTSVSLAERAGVPAVSLFRDLDGLGQNASVMRRFLDQGVFKASQEGEAVLVGRLRSETVSALMIWGLQDRVSRVSLVPISTVLKARVQ